VDSGRALPHGSPRTIGAAHPTRPIQLGIVGFRWTSISPAACRFVGPSTMAGVGVDDNNNIIVIIVETLAAT